MSGQLNEVSSTGQLKARADTRAWRSRSDGRERFILVDPDHEEATRLGVDMTRRGVQFVSFVSPWRALAHIGSEAAAVVVVSSRLGRDALEDVVAAVRLETDFPVLIAYDPDETEVIGPAVVAGGRPVVIHPYDASEIIHSICRTLPGPQPPSRLEFGRLSLVPEWQDAHLDELGMDLSPLEFRVLAELVRREGRAASSDALISAAWSGTSSEPKGLLAAAMKRIRHKFTTLGVQDAVTTVRGVGYRLNSAAFQPETRLRDSHNPAVPISPMSRSTRAEMSSTIRRTS